MRRLMIGIYTVSAVAGVSAVDDQTAPAPNPSEAELELSVEGLRFPAALIYMRWVCEDELFVEKANGIWMQTDTNDGGTDKWKEAGSNGRFIELPAVNNPEYQTRLYFSGEKTMKQAGENQFVHHRNGRWME